MTCPSEEKTMPIGTTIKKATLENLLTPPVAADEADMLRWRVAVPLVSNPFLLMDFTLFAVCGAGLVLFTLLTGVWFTEGRLTVEDLRASAVFTAWIFAAIILAFVVLGLLCFRNRYFALFRFDNEGIYSEGCRGTDQRNDFFCPFTRPCPVWEPLHSAHVTSRHLPWYKVKSFVDIPSMRVIHLKRGCWHMLRLYTPDAVTHAKVVASLVQRLHKESGKSSP